jgi:hypothetical protein
VLIVNSEGKRDYVHVVARGRVELPKGFNVDPNWAAVRPYLKFDLQVEQVKPVELAKQKPKSEGSI